MHTRPGGSCTVPSGQWVTVPKGVMCSVAIGNKMSQALEGGKNILRTFLEVKTI
jgi:hypothetical protein